MMADKEGRPDRFRGLIDLEAAERKHGIDLLVAALLCVGVLNRVFAMYSLMHTNNQQRESLAEAVFERNLQALHLWGTSTMQELVGAVDRLEKLGVEPLLAGAHKEWAELLQVRDRCTQKLQRMLRNKLGFHLDSGKIIQRGIKRLQTEGLATLSRGASEKTGDNTFPLVDDLLLAGVFNGPVSKEQADEFTVAERDLRQLEQVLMPVFLDLYGDCCQALAPQDFIDSS